MIKFISRLDLQGSRIDRDKGIIKGVSLIALGEARGHNKQVDQRTLETVRDCAKEYGDGLRVKFNPTTFQHGVGSLLGYIPPNTLRIEDSKCVGDLHVYKSFPNDAKDYLYEIAERTPGNIGLSIEFTGDDEVIDGSNFARCDQIFAATVVDLPAANPTGLFAEHLTKEQDSNKNASKQTTIEELDMDEATIKKLAGEFAGAMKPVLTQAFAEAGFPPKKNDDGNGDGGDKTSKPPAAGEEEGKPAPPSVAGAETAPPPVKPPPFPVPPTKTVAQMTAQELSSLIQHGNMQFFTKTGNRPAKINPEPKHTDGDPFEVRITQHMSAGAKSRGLAITRARKDAPEEYNAWMAKKNPNVQQMAVK